MDCRGISALVPGEPTLPPSSDPNGYLIFLTSSFLSPNSYSMLFLLFEMMEDLHGGAQLYPARSLSSNGQPLASSYRAKTFLCKQHTTIFVCSQWMLSIIPVFFFFFFRNLENAVKFFSCRPSMQQVCLWSLISSSDEHDLEPIWQGR